MQKNVLMRICTWVCIGIAAVVVLSVLAKKTYQMAEQQQRSELVKRAEESAQTLNCDVMVSEHDITGQSYFSYLYERLQELGERYPHEQIVCYVDGETSLEGLARVEIGNPEKSDLHYLYLVQNDMAYEICGNMNQDQWNECLDRLFLEEKLFLVDVCVDGIVLNNSAFDFTYDEELAGLTTIAVYSFGSYEADASSYERSMEAGEFVLVSKKTFSWGGQTEEEVCVRKVEAFPDYENERELFSYLQEQYPDVEAYSVYASNSPKTTGYYGRLLVENNRDHCFFYWEGQNYEVVSEEKNGGNAVIPNPMCEDTDAYSSKTYAEWTKFKDGSGFWNNQKEGSYCLQQDVGEEKDILVQIRPIENIRDESRKYVIEVYWEKDDSPFQSILTESVALGNVYSYLYDKFFYVDHVPFSFQDFNVDGYLDINYINAGSSKVFSHYIWSPSQQKFVRGPEELEQCLKYYIYDEDSRRFKVTKAGTYESSIDYYQWSNETDCEQIKTFHAGREENGNGVFVRIADCCDGEEQVIMDYDYDIEDYPYSVDRYAMQYSFFVSFCEDNLLWEETVRDKDFGESYRLYYAQEALTNYMGIASGEIEGHLWVLDENTKLVKKLFWKEPAFCERVSWEDELVIQYFDGSEKRWTLEEILKDPAKEIYDRSMQIDYTVKEFPIDTIKYDVQTDKQYKDAYYKAVSNQIPVRQLKGEKIYLKGYFYDSMERTDEEYLEDLIQDTHFYYMDFDGDGMPELVMDVMYGGGLHILKYLPEEDVVEFFFASYRMPYYNLLGAGQLCYHHPCLANKDIWAYEVVDENGQTENVAYFLEDYDYVHPDDGSWQGTYWVDLNDELGMVQVDEESYKEITKNFFEAVKNAPSEMSFEEIFGE